MKPAPVCSRSRFTASALMSIVVVMCSSVSEPPGLVCRVLWCSCSMYGLAGSSRRGVPVGFLLGGLAGELRRDLLGRGAVLGRCRRRRAAGEQVVVLVGGEAQGRAAGER